MAVKPTRRQKTDAQSRADAKSPVNRAADRSEEQPKDPIQERYAQICDTVNQDIRDAIMARQSSGIEDIWADDEDQYNGVDSFTAPYTNVKTPDQVPGAKGQQSGAIRDSSSKVFVPITKPKTDTGVARVTEMLVPTNDQPWEIAPNEMPEIDQAIDNLSQEIVYSADGDQEYTAYQAAVAIKHGATEKAKAEQAWIETQLQHGKVYAEFRQCIRDSGRIGSGVMKGPVPVSRTIKKWKTTRVPAVGTQPSQQLLGSVDPNQPPPAAAPQQGATATPAGGANPQSAQSPQQQSGGMIPPLPQSGITQTPATAPAVPAQPPLPQITSTLLQSKVVEPTSVCIRAQDLYPDPSCGDDLHRGAFVVEREFMTPKQLRELASLPGYDAAAVVASLREGPKPYGNARDPTFRPVLGDTVYDSKLFEIYHYYGEASPADLMVMMARGTPDGKQQAPHDQHSLDSSGSTSYGESTSNPLDSVLSKEDQLWLQSVPVQVTMCNTRPIRAVLNPMEGGGFPFDVLPWELVKGQIWGRGIPHKMAVAQRIVNAAVRAMLANAGLSMGPQIVLADGVVEPWDGQYEVRGRKGWKAKLQESGIDDVRKAFAVIEVKSIQQEAMGIIEWAFQLADQLTNMPMLIQGDQQAGTSPETLGGMKLLMQNALSPLRVIAKLADDKLFEPHLTRYHEWAMEKGPDIIKGGDTRVKARGSSALIQREEAREFLMQVFPVKDDPSLRIDPVKFIREMAKANGFDMSTVQYDADEWKVISAQRTQSAPQDPRVQAAQIAAEATIQAQQLKSQDVQASVQGNQQAASADAQAQVQIKQLELQIAQLKAESDLKGKLIGGKVQLATAAMSNRQEAERMNRDTAQAAAGVNDASVPA